MRFIGRLHPHFVTPLEAIARQENSHLFVSDLVVRHHAYLSVLTEDKLRWANRLLERELQDRPGQLHYLIEYGRNLLRLNDPRGHSVLAEAADLVLAYANDPRPPTPTVASLLEYVLTASPEQSRCRLTPQQAVLLAGVVLQQPPAVVAPGPGRLRGRGLSGRRGASGTPRSPGPDENV